MRFAIVCLIMLGLATPRARLSAQIIDERQWSGIDIGRTGAPGTVRVDSARRMVSGAGVDIWGQGDSFNFVFVPWERDVEIVARVVAVGKTHSWAKAGIMVRADLSEFSPHAMVAMTPEQGAAFLRRQHLGGSTRDDAHQAMRLLQAADTLTYQQRGSAGAERAVGSVTASSLPRWVRLVRRGNTVIGYDSADGVQWEWLGTDTVELGATVYVGLAVTSHDPNVLCDAEFDNVRIGRASIEAGANGVMGYGDGLMGRYFATRDTGGSAIERIDPEISFDWGYGAPIQGLGRDRFGVVWEGEVEAQFDEPYAFHVSSDDRARFWLDGHLIIDEWYEHAESVSSAMVELEAGRRYVVRLEYFENRGRACISLLWSSPSTPRQTIPQRQLYSKISTAHRDEVLLRYEADANPRPRSVEESGLPGGWVSQDVGRVGEVGHAEVNDGVWRITGAGADIWANADGFQFVYQDCTGDLEVVVRVLSQDATDPWGKAGLMLRQGLAAGAPHVLLAVTPIQGINLVRRETQGADSSITAGPATRFPCWLKLVRQGGSVAGYTSEDGAVWRWVGTESLGGGGDWYVGMAVNSHDNSALGEALFDNLRIGPPENPGSAELFTGSGRGLQATYFDLQTGNLVKRIDSRIDFDWDVGSPAEGIGTDLFSVRWEGFIEAASDGIHALHVRSDDGARLWIDDRLVLDAWRDQGANERSVQIQLQAGRKYPIKLEYYERGGEAMVQLQWSNPMMPREPVPSSQLYATATSGAAPVISETAEQPGESPGSPAVDITSLLDIEYREALADRVTGVTDVCVLAGAASVERLGRWEQSGTGLYAVDRRGFVEYELSVSNAGIHQLEIEGKSHTRLDLNRTFELVLSIDGEQLGRRLLDTGFEGSGRVRILTPWLQPGRHRVRVYWDNARQGRSLELLAVRLQSLAGEDADQDGVPDWMRWWLKETCGIETGEGQTVIRSRTSPLCLEGRGQFLSMMKVTVGGEEVRVEPAPNDRWYADVPLAAAEPVELEVSYQNGGYRELTSLIWEPTQLMEGQEVAVRCGDSLLLTVGDDAANGGESSNRDATLQADGVAVQLGNPSELWIRRFDDPGTFQSTSDLCSHGWNRCRGRTPRACTPCGARCANGRVGWAGASVGVAGCGK